jgi:hypothetical protein
MSVTRPARRVNRESVSIPAQNTLVENEFQVIATCLWPSGSADATEVFTESPRP